MWDIAAFERETIKPLEAIQNECVASHQYLLGVYANRLPLTDPRLLTARQMVAPFRASLFDTVFARDCLMNLAWWDQPERRESLRKSNLIRDVVNDYVSVATTSFMVFPISVFESGLRRVVRAMDAGACANGGAAFESIYKWLFKRLRDSGWHYPGGEEESFLDLFRNLRNTIHNNGVFWARDGSDHTVVWRGTTYDFPHGKKSSNRPTKKFSRAPAATLTPHPAPSPA